MLLSSRLVGRSWKLQDPPVREEYQERVSKKLDSSESGNENIEVCWQNLRDCMKEAAIEVYVFLINYISN